MDSLNILHLSDLHLANPPVWDQSLLLGALKEDLSKIRFTTQAPNLVVFSGDLAKSAGTDDAYTPVLEVLMGLLETLGIPESGLLVCPGNHDVDRRSVGPALPDLSRFRQKASTTYGLNELVTSTEFRGYVSNTFSGFQALADMFSGHACISSDVFSATYFFREYGLGVVALNTATLSAGGLTENVTDQGHLAVAERTIIEALDKLPSSSATIIVGHHPFSWLNEENQALMERIVSRRASAYLSGHLHDTLPRQAKLMTGSFLHAQSGALYCGRKYWNGYALLSLVPSKSYTRLAYRRWFEQRSAFSKAEDLGDDGLFFSSPEAEAYWRAVTPTTDLVMLERWRDSSLLPYVVDRCNDTMSGLSSESLFVAPDFDREVPYRAEVDGRVGSRIENLTLNEVVESQTNYVVSAQPETGKTTLLKHIAYLLATKPIGSAGWSVPALIQFGSVKNFSASVARLIRDQLPDLPDEITIRSLLAQGYVTILVDDMDFAQAGKRKSLIEFITQNPKCRFILASSTTFVEVAALQPEVAPGVPFTRVRMRPFRKGQLQTLVEKHGLKDPLKVDQMVERVIRDASSLNVPLTAVTGTFLIQIIREEPEATVINQAALIERYIEMLLQKYAPRELLPGTFDFRNKVDLLCHITERMTREDQYDPGENDLVKWVIDYLSEYGLRFSAADLVSYFVESRLLEKQNGRIRFRLRMFFEFFAASRMIDNRDFREYVFSDDRYLCFINEIGFYSALSRKDRDELDRIASNFEKMSQALWPAGDALHDPDKYLRSLALPDKKTTEDELTSLQMLIKSPEQLASERKELLEGTDFEDSEQTQSVKRREFLTPQEQWLGHLLLLSGMLKHMELIPNADKKSHLITILDGWVRFTAMSLSVVSELAKNKRVMFNGVTYRSSLSDDLPVGEVARRLTLYMPIATARMATVFLGSEKLRPQIEDQVGSRTEALSRQFIRAAMLADLGTDGIADLAEKTAQALRGTGYLEHVFARKMYEVAVRFRLAKDDLDGVKAIVGDLFTHLNAAPKGKYHNTKVEIMRSISRQRLQIGLSKKE